MAVYVNQSFIIMDTPNKFTRLAILGSTGSIGTQTLDVVEHSGGRYRISVLAAGSRVDDLISQAIKFKPQLAIIARRDLAGILAEALSPYGIETASGPEALAEAVTRDDVDMVVTATVGFSGLLPTVNAITAGKDIALANKETLVVAGSLINRLLKQSSSRIYPVDSEHSAIAQCLVGEDPESVHRLIITASGGPFRSWPARRIAEATAKDALKHPNWSMGAKITIDSATMLNKAFEIIEAHYLFGIAPERIRAVVHPQSIVHSMVEFKDGAIKAQLGVPDMHLPIAYALGCGKRLGCISPRLKLSDISTMTFEEPDTKRFPAITLAQYALERGGNTSCTINGANEIANAAFINGKIGFNDIYKCIVNIIDSVEFVEHPSLEDLLETDRKARHKASEYISSL